LLFLTSKLSWFISMPFVLYTIFIYRNTLSKKDKFKLSLISLIFTILAFAFFLQIPQGTRSLSENNLSLFSDISIKNGINWIRGQGLESGWPPLLERILISKAFFFPIGILHWLSNIQPSVLFSQFSKDGNLGFAGMGAFPKVTIIPFLMGLIFLIRDRKSKLLLYPVVIILPAALIYPQLSPRIVILTLPFISFVIAFGFLQVKKILGRLIIIFIVLELLINFLFLSLQIKLTDELRPYWVKPIVQDAFKLSNTDQVLISDDFAQDLAPFIEWYTPFISQTAFLNSRYPYKFHQTNLGNIKLIGFSDSFKACDSGEKSKLFLSKRDFDRAKKFISDNVARTYLNSKGLAVVYFMEDRGCII